MIDQEKCIDDGIYECAYCRTRCWKFYKSKLCSQCGGPLIGAVLVIPKPERPPIIYSMGW